MALKFKPEALFKGGAKAAPKKAASAVKKVLISACSSQSAGTSICQEAVLTNSDL